MFGYLSDPWQYSDRGLQYSPAAHPGSSIGRSLARPGVLTALAFYIIVGLGYNILLRNHAPFIGLHWLAHESLHSAVPLLFVLYWVLYVARADLQVRHRLLWLIYPLG
jgi:hypothetical protein